MNVLASSRSLALAAGLAVAAALPAQQALFTPIPGTSNVPGANLTSVA